MATAKDDVCLLLNARVPLDVMVRLISLYYI